jgi:ABC-2 type transport system ATP-binding protein
LPSTPLWKTSTSDARRNTPAINAISLHKSYGDHVVLGGVDLTVAEGEIFALLGPNGAGKSTTIGILTTLISADSGAVQIAGHDLATDPDAVRAAMAVTGQFSAVDNLLTGEENLILMADLHHLRPGGGPAPRPRLDRPVRPGCGRRPPGRDLLGGNAAPARPGDGSHG